MGGCCCRSVSDKGSRWVAGGVMFFIRSSTQCILPTPVGAKGRADTWQQPAPFCLTPEFTLIHKKILLCLHSRACMKGDTWPVGVAKQDGHAQGPQKPL